MSRHHRYNNTYPKALRDDIKRAVIRTHGLVCWLCTQPISSFEEATMDHVKKASRGELYEEGNLRPAHAKCNNERHRRGGPMPTRSTGEP